LNSFVFTQEKSYSATIGFRFNRLDFYQENSILLRKTKIVHEFGFGFGINKMIFQQRLNPELFYSLSSNFKNEDKFQTHLVGSIHSNFYNANKNQREIHFFTEFMAGFRLSYGIKHAFSFIPQFGLVVESFNSTYFNQINHHLNFNYSAKIAYTYRF
jgi:hypothetical protein